MKLVRIEEEGRHKIDRITDHATSCTTELSLRCTVSFRLHELEDRDKIRSALARESYFEFDVST